MSHRQTEVTKKGEKKLQP